MDVARIARRDGWSCWICGGETDRSVPPTAAGAPTVDHVLPRALGGTSDPVNLRVAHRRCNGARGSRLPELAWPAGLAVSMPADLLGVVRRRLRRPGEPEVVALAGDGGEEAAAWVQGAVESVFGGAGLRWAAEPAGAAPTRILLRCEDGGVRRPSRRR